MGSFPLIFLTRGRGYSSENLEDHRTRLMFDTDTSKSVSRTVRNLHVASGCRDSLCFLGKLICHSCASWMKYYFEVQILPANNCLKKRRGCFTWEWETPNTRFQEHQSRGTTGEKKIIFYYFSSLTRPYKVQHRGVKPTWALLKVELNSMMMIIQN